MSAGTAEAGRAARNPHAFAALGLRNPGGARGTRTAGFGDRGHLLVRHADRLARAHRVRRRERRRRSHDGGAGDAVRDAVGRRDGRLLRDVALGRGRRRGGQGTPRAEAAQVDPDAGMGVRRRTGGAAAVFGAVSVAITMLLALTIYGVRLPAASVVPFVLTVTVALLAYCALGMAVASLTRSARLAEVISIGAAVVLSFISGVFVIGDGLPAWLDALARVFPLEPLRHFAAGPVRSGREWGAVGVPAARGHRRVGHRRRDHGDRDIPVGAERTPATRARSGNPRERRRDRRGRPARRCGVADGERRGRIQPGDRGSDRPHPKRPTRRRACGPCVAHDPASPW